MTAPTRARRLGDRVADPLLPTGLWRIVRIVELPQPGIVVREAGAVDWSADLFLDDEGWGLQWDAARRAWCTA